MRTPIVYRTTVGPPKTRRPQVVVDVANSSAGASRRSADDWDAQMLYFVAQGYRVIAHDRRGHGRSSQVGDGHDMDHYAADTAAVVAASRPARRRPHRPFDRRRRGDALCRAPRPGPCRQAGAHRSRAADHGEDTDQSRRTVHRGFRRTAQAARRQSRAVLSRFRERSVLQLQPSGAQTCPRP